MQVLSGASTDSQKPGSRRKRPYDARFFKKKRVHTVLSLSRLRGIKLTIFSRLILGNLVVLIMATGVSIYAILQLGQMKKITHRITQVHTVLIGLEKDMTDALLSETRYEKKFVLIQDPALHDGFLASKADFEKYLNEAMALADSATIRKALERVQALNRSYHALFEQEIAALKAGSRIATKPSSREKERLVSEAVRELDQLKALSQQNILHKIQELDETGTTARTVAMLITGMALLLGIALSIGITRSITLPLSRMQKKTGEVAEGIFEADLDIQSPPEIGALAGAFNSMSIRLKQVERMKSDFFSLMSHELRTPLTSIREGTNMFLEGLGGAVTDKQRELLVIIAEESSRLIELVNSLLDLSRLRAGVLKLNLSNHNLTLLVARSIREVAPLAAAKAIAIESDMEEIPQVAVEPERILQVLRNLIGNALKFTPRDGNVRITVRRAEAEVMVSITDTGPGIPEQEQNVIFEKFRQASSASPPGFQGTGLGLAIVRHIIKAHGGRVWVESTIGQGSTFTFALPV